MKLHFSIITILAATLLLASCGKSNTEGRHIPANALMAMHIDGKLLSEKLPWEEIKNNPLFEDAYTDKSISEPAKKILDNPDNSGVDTKSSLIFFLQKDAEGGYMAFEGKIKDGNIFKKFCNGMMPEGKASENSGINYISHNSTCVGWDNEKFIYVADAPQLGEMDELSKRMKRDSIGISNHRPRDMNATCKAVFDLDKGKSLATSEKFSKLLAEKGDMHIWINSEEFAKNSLATSLSFGNLSKGNATGLTVNFDNGKININSHTYGGEELIKLYKKYSGGKVDEDMLQRIPGKDVMAALALNFKPEGLKEFLKLSNLDGFFNIGAASLGFTMDDFIKANKGDIVIGVSDFTMAADTSKYVYKDAEAGGMDIPPMPKPKFNFVFSASVGDKDAFNKLIETGKKATATFVNSGSFPVAYSTNGKIFALSNSQENADGAVNGKGNGFDFVSKISGGPMAGYFNIQSIIKAFGTEAAKDSSAKMVYDASLKTWENVLIKGGGYSDGTLNLVIDINMVDKNTNSLKQLNQYAAVLGKLAKERERKQREDMMALEDAMQNGGIKSDEAPVAKEK